MDEFVLPIDVAKFRSTNAAWNNLMLNDPWSVGYVTALIALEPFKRKEDWEKFYYDSGLKREGLIAGLNFDEKGILQDEQLVRTDKSRILKLRYELKNLNNQFGRTKERLFRKGQILYDNVKDNGYELTVDECFEAVRFRVICETWNGVIIRENNTIENLQNLFPDLEFRKVSGEMDHKYAVDFEVYKDNRLSLGLQIKPQSYTWNAPYIQKAKYANKMKNNEYFKEFNVKVYDVISDSKGNIINKEVLKNL